MKIDKAKKLLKIYDSLKNAGYRELAGDKWVAGKGEQSVRHGIGGYTMETLGPALELYIKA